MSPPSDTIGILDSGVGGLSVLSEIQHLLPHTSIHYIGDSAWCPYGNKPPQDIISRSTVIAEQLIDQGAQLLVVACNSATIHAVETLRNIYPIPIVGMEPAIKPAASLTQTGTIGVLATEASIAGEKFHRLLNTHAGEIRTLTTPAPGLVTLVENGDLDSDHASSVIRSYIDPLLEKNADVIVLGCTHYPFLRPLIQKLIPKNIQIVDTGAAVAKQVKRLLSSDQNGHSLPRYNIQTTGPIDKLEKLYPTLCPNLTAHSSLSHLTL